MKPFYQQTTNVFYALYGEGIEEIRIVRSFFWGFFEFTRCKKIKKEN